MKKVLSPRVQIKNGRHYSTDKDTRIIVPVKQKKKKSSVDCDYFLTIGYTCVLGAQKVRLIETVLLSTRNICFD